MSILGSSFKFLANQAHPVNVEGTAVRGRLGSNMWQWPLIAAASLSIVSGIPAGTEYLGGILSNASLGLDALTPDFSA